jgi:hypothetical protein
MLMNDVNASDASRRDICGRISMSCLFGLQLPDVMDHHR